MQNTECRCENEWKQLIRILSCAKCEGPEPQDAGCIERRMQQCRQILSLDYCALNRLAEALMEAGVMTPGWIPAAERLPEPFKQVLVCRMKPDGLMTVEQGYKDLGKWWKVYGTRVTKILYWMPLPEPPEVTGNE